MLYRVYGPIAAEPSLHLALQHVARTPTARLSIVYEIQRRLACASISPCAAQLAEQACVCHSKPLSQVEVAELLAARSIHHPFQLPRNVGNELYLDSILAGGVDGQTLPLSVCRRIESYLPPSPLGMTTDVVG